MEPGDESADFPEGTEFEPERWETAIEDFAQIVALGIDRAQDLADVLGDFARTRPGLAKTLGAVTIGAAAGVVIAAVTSRGGRPGHDRHAVRRATANGRLADDLAALAGQLVQLAAGRLAGRSSGDSSGTEHSGSTRRGWMPRPRVHPGDVAQLVPVAFTLIRNPLVRQFVVRSALRAARRG